MGSTSLEEKISPKLPHACSPLWAAGRTEDAFRHLLAGQELTHTRGLLGEPPRAGRSWPELVDTVGWRCASCHTQAELELITGQVG